MTKKSTTQCTIIWEHGTKIASLNAENQKFHDDLATLSSAHASLSKYHKEHGKLLDEYSAIIDEQRNLSIRLMMLSREFTLKSTIVGVICSGLRINTS